MKKRYLILENGKIFEGEAIGADKTSVGELIFTTGMCGYIETLTDPSYYGQIVVQTFPLIGNYGYIPSDSEGECVVKGYVVSEICEVPSNFRSEKPLEDFLKEKQIPGIKNVDTRELTKILRESGVMNAVLSDDKNISAEELKSYRVKNAVKSVTSKEIKTYGNGKRNIALIDYGAKKNIIRELVKRDCKVTVYPCTATAKEILSKNYDGIMLSNGPGDPAENTEEIEEIKKLVGKKPIFGICLGHQLLALADGGRTVKMKYGHRGANQPVKEVGGTRTYITSQNHGYEVLGDTLNSGKVSFVNANDGTCEGVEYKDKKAFSVQFHPEAAAGPRDTAFLFDRFIGMTEEGKNASE